MIAPVDQTPPSLPPLEPSAAKSRSVTLRAVAIGSVAAALMCWILPYNDFVVGNTPLVGSYLPLAAVLAIFVLVVLVNAPLRALAPRGALSGGELAVVLTMLLVGASVPGQGLLRAFIPSLVGPFFFGQSNQQFWNAFSKLDLPAWMFPVESMDAGRSGRVVQEFYNRTPAGESMPLAAWIAPLLGVGIFIGGMLLTFVSLAFLLRVQWGANERLAFPLAQLQLSLIEEPAPGRALNSLFRSKSFWITAGVVFFVHSLSVLGDYFPRHVVKIPLSYDFTGMLSNDPWDKLPWDIKKATVFFTLVGVTYFIQSRTAFSLWAIWVITQFTTMQTRVAGGDIPLVAWRDQHLAACVVYVIGMLFLARHFIARVTRSFSTRDREFAAERWALLGVIAGIGLMTAWMMFAGAGVWMTLLAVGMILVAHLSTARIVAETGLPFVRTRPGADQVFTNFPAKSLAGRDVFLAGFATSNGVYYNRESALAFTQHALRVGEGAAVIPRETGPLAAVIAWTLILCIGVGTISSLRTYYTWNSSIAPGEPQVENKWGLQNTPEETIVKPLANWSEGRFPNPPHNPYTHFGIGAGVTALLQILTWRLSWWPFVPVGYIFAGTWTFVAQAWFSIMIGWLAKVVILRFGGAALFQKARGIFIGLIFGEALAAGVWLVINMLLASAGYDYYPIRFLPA